MMASDKIYQSLPRNNEILKKSRRLTAVFRANAFRISIEILANHRFFLENRRNFSKLYWISSFPFRTFKEFSRNVQKTASSIHPFCAYHGTQLRPISCRQSLCERRQGVWGGEGYLSVPLVELF
jgi:hypothetical protein